MQLCIVPCISVMYVCCRADVQNNKVESCIFDLEPLYTRIAFTDKKSSIHTRIIWACAWSHDDRYFVTVSRDKKVSVNVNAILYLRISSFLLFE